MPNPFLYIETVLFQIIQFSMSTVFVYTQLNIKTVLFQTIQFSISTQFSYIWPIDRTLSGATTLRQSGSGSDDNKGVLHIPQSSGITGTSPSDCFVSYPGHSLGESYESVYSVAPANWAIVHVSVFLICKKKKKCNNIFSKRQ